MNKYVIPICNIPKSKVYNLTIIANSNKDCQEKLMEKFSEYSENDNYVEFIKELDNKDIIIGTITDVEEL